MSFDYKKEYKEFYMPKNKPSIVQIPKMNYLAVRGHGDPNLENGEYSQSIPLLYSIAFTLKMSPKTNYKIDGYFDYVVPPLEGLWWVDDYNDIDLSLKDKFNFISMIRLPDFITKKDFDWAINEATNKKKIDFSKVEFFTYEESLCIQMMHIGPYDTEPESVRLMDEYLESNGYLKDFSDSRLHHEIYLGDPRKTKPENLKTILRHPIRKK